MARCVLSGLLGLLLVLILVGCKPSDSRFPRPQGEFTVKDDQKTAMLVDIQVISNADPIHVNFALTNPTDEELVYAVKSKRLIGLNGLEGVLYRDGKMIKGDIKADEAAFNKNQVRRLKPKEVVLLQYEMPHTKLPAGAYELRLVYQIYPNSVANTDHGLTAIKLEHTILLDVRSE